MLDLKKIFKGCLPASWIDRWKLWKARKKYSNFTGKSTEEVFTQIFETNYWSNQESISGPGSSDLETRAVRVLLPQLIEDLKIETLLDVPCGDFRWMQSIDLKNCNYVGGDIVRKLIELNQERYGNSKYRFVHCDITKDKLPNTDLILCRDCFFHLSFAQITAAINNFKSTKARYLLTTTHTDTLENSPMVTGGYRPINLCLPPFNFPTPIQLIYERRDAGFADTDKSLGLWQISDL